MSNPIHPQTLPWDGGQFRRLDAAVMGGAVLLCLAIGYVKLPPEPVKKMVERVVPVAPTITLAPAKDIPAPKPVIVPKPLPEPVKPVVKPTPKPEVKAVAAPKTDVKQPTKAVVVEAPKAAPRAAAPAKPAEKPSQATQMGSPDKPAVQTIRPAQATTDKGPVNTPATTPKPTPLPTNTPAPVSHSTGPSAAEQQAAARKRAQAAVNDIGLGNAISGVTSGTSSKTKPVEGRGIQKGGIEGGKPDVRLNPAAGGGTGGNGAAKSGVNFGSATEGDKTGKGLGSLSGRGSKDVSGAQIRDSNSADSVGKGSSDNGDGNAKKGKSKRGDVERVMSQAKGKLNSAYKRALDEDPTMQGSITVRLKISADGSVISASIVSSDLNNATLESKMIAIIKGMNFDSGEYDTWDDTYKFNFIPQ